MPQTLALQKKTNSPQKLTLKNYTTLKSEVRKAIQLGKERAITAVEQEKVRTSWEVGKLILEHILLNKGRADYGRKVIEKLADDLLVSGRELSYMLEFARAYPILPQAAELSWSHYRELLSVNDSQKREALTKQAIQKHWGRDHLRIEVRNLKLKKRSPTEDALAEFNSPPLQKTGAYRTLTWRGKAVYDLGFSTYLEIKKKKTKKIEPKPDELYYYEAVVDRVVDGDTFWADIHLGFGIWSYQKLRLRGLNAPELPTRAGSATKKFLERHFKKAQEITIKTTKSDKYDRYLADCWAGPTYLNALLIKKGLAASVNH